MFSVLSISDSDKHFTSALAEYQKRLWKHLKIEDLKPIKDDNHQLVIQKETKNQLNHTDININPNLKDIKITSFDQKKTILDAGYQEALKYIEALKKLPKKSKEDKIKIDFNQY